MATDGGLLRDAAGALRAPWRVVLFLVLAGVSLVVAPVLAFPLVWVRDRPLVELFGATVALTLAMLAVHALAFRIGRWGSWETVGLGRAAASPRRLVTGTLLGVLTVGVPSLLVLAIGWYRLDAGTEGNATVTAVQLALALLPAALWEELLARGYLFAVLRETWGAPAALLVTSLGFGLLHLGNPGANLQAVAQVTFAGVWLGGVLMATGSLYAAWLAHAAWNWTMAALLHAPVSGTPFEAPGWELRDAGPDWATGGAWGPEASLFVLATMSLSLIYLFARRRRRGES